MTFNFKNYQKPSREIPPEGNYTMVIRSIEKKKSNAGNDMLVFGLDIALGEYKNHYQKYPSLFFVPCHNDYWFDKLHDNFLKIIRSNLNADVNILNSESFDPQCLIGMNVGAKLKLKEGRDDLLVIGYLNQLNSEEINELKSLKDD